MVGSMTFFSRTMEPPRQKVRVARGRRRPESVHRHLTSGPIFSTTSNCTIPPSTNSSSPTFKSAHPMTLHIWVSSFILWLKNRGWHSNKGEKSKDSVDGQTSIFYIPRLQSLPCMKGIKYSSSESPEHDMASYNPTSFRPKDLKWSKNFDRVLRYTLSKALIVDLNSEGRKRPFKCAHCEKPLLPFLHPQTIFFLYRLPPHLLLLKRCPGYCRVTDRSQEKE